MRTEPPRSACQPVPRRRFLRSAGAMAALPGMPLDDALSAPSSRRETDGTISMAFWEPVDVLICGSTLFACQLAVDSARAGLRTALMMERVNPFYEGVTCLRSWVDAARIRELPEVLRAVVSHPATHETIGDRLYFNASKAALDIEDCLCEAGVRFFYNAAVAGALGHGEGYLAGVVFGGKPGLFALEARAIVDATPEATVARCAGARYTPLPGPRRYRYVADLASPAVGRQGAYLARNGVHVRFTVHHYYADFDLVVDSRSSGPFALAEDFERVYSAALECPWAEGEKRFRGADGFLGTGPDRLESTAGKVAGLDNLLVFGPQGVTGNQDGSLILQDPLALFSAFRTPLDPLRAALRPGFGPRPTYEFLNRGAAPPSEPTPGAAHHFLDPGFSEPGTSLAAVRFQAPCASLRAEAAVVGGGTSGNAAAYTCASLGLKTVCLERGHELGGTNTIGGVNKLWFGRHTRAFQDYYQAMDAQDGGSNAPGFFRGLTKTGARLLFGSVVTGVGCAGTSLRRVYVITPAGLTAVEAANWIDATGDGSLAAWAGCDYTFGGAQDELTLWASFANYRPGNPEAARPFLSPLDERSPLDLTRFILAMRRNSGVPLLAKHVPPPFYVAARESRHIRGGKTVTFLDVLAGRRFRDGVFRAESNPDIKGVATSDAAKAGFIPVDWKRALQVTVPYSALIPRGVDHLFIAGKAYSATHDALSTARMQKDLCVMGLVAGHAVRLAVQRNVPPRDIPVRELQATLISQGVLAPEDISEDDFGFGMEVPEIARKLAATTDMDESLAESAMLCLLPRDQVLPLLESCATPAHPPLVRVLAFLGSKLALGQYLTEVAQALDEPVLSTELFGRKGTTHLMPDQGYAPTPALRLHSLAHARERRAVPLLVKLAHRVSFDPKDLRSSWGYFFALACGFERLACTDGQAPLKHVLGQDLFRDAAVSRGADLRACKDIRLERLTYLRLALARALTRCGDPEGALLLCGFLDEARVAYARAARAELVAASGQDYAYRPAEWRRWIEANRANLKPNPSTVAFG